MGDAQDSLVLLAPRLALWLALASGVLLNYFGVKFFATQPNAALFAAGGLLAAVRGVTLLGQDAAPAWLDSLLPLGIWGATVFLTYVDRKLHLSNSLTFPGGVIATVLLVLVGWLVLLRTVDRSISSAEFLSLAVLSAVLVFLGGLVLVRIQDMKPALIVACALFGSVVLVYVLWHLPALTAAAGPTLPSPPAVELAAACLPDPAACFDRSLNGSVLPRLLPPTSLPWLLVPFSGLLVQALILLRARRAGTVERLGAGM